MLTLASAYSKDLPKFTTSPANSTTFSTAAAAKSMILSKATPANSTALAFTESQPLAELPSSLFTSLALPCRA